MFKFQTSDDKLFELPKELFKWSETMKDVADDFGNIEEVNSIIPLPNVASREFERVITYFNHLNEMELRGEKVQKKNKKNKNKKIKLSEWDNKFLALEKKELFNLFNVSNYLKIEILLENCSKYIAETIAGKDVKWIRDYFEEPDDLSPEEKKKINEENKWIQDVQNSSD